MSAPRLSVEKAAFSNIFVGVRATIQNLREETDYWQGWDRATARGFAEHQRKIRQLKLNEDLLRDLENLATTKKTRKREAAGGLKSRNMLVMCGACGYKCRIARSWIDVGIPKCPNPDCDSFDSEMAQEEFFGDDGGTVGAVIEQHQDIHGTKPYLPDEVIGEGFKCAAHGTVDCPICSSV